MYKCRECKQKSLVIVGTGCYDDTVMRNIFFLRWCQIYKWDYYKIPVKITINKYYRYNRGKNKRQDYEYNYLKC